MTAAKGSGSGACRAEDASEAYVGERDGSIRIVPWPVFVSELAGTALLLLVGLSLVVLMFGDGSPITGVLPSEGWRRLITGFLFGTTGALIALSPVGKRSGAHINPVVTLAFRLMGKLDLRTTLGYVVAQLSGAVLGALPLLAWGSMGRSVAFGATLPGAGYATGTVLLGEVITTFAMVAGLAVCLGFRRIRRFTPAMFPFLYAVMVYVESPISGTSTNPARSLGPAIVSGQWESWWIYWVGPLVGAVAACLACSALAKRITVAKLYHFDSDRDRLFRRVSAEAEERATAPSRS
jgi:aquaporin Z